MVSKLATAFAVGSAALALASTAEASSWTVGPRKSCPGADFRKIQKAIDAADPGDTITVCAGTFVEGKGKPGSNALTVDKSLTIRGAGVDRTVVEPNPNRGGILAAAQPDLRGGAGDILAAVGTPDHPITVKLSGLTFDAHGVDVTAGVAFVDAQGSIAHTHVTGIALDESATGYTKPGGFRNDSFGDGIVDVTAATAPPRRATTRTLTIDHTRVDTYNAIGVLIDGATSDFSQYVDAPITPSGIVNHAVLTNDVIAGRNSCQNYNDPTAGGPTVIDGDCQWQAAPRDGSAPPLPPPLPLPNGPLFGQDGVRVSGGASVEMLGDTVSSNLVHGDGAPVGSVFAPTPNNDPFPLGSHSENNQNLRLGAGVRLVGAAASSIT
jgi:hypothetical protein